MPFSFMLAIGDSHDKQHKLGLRFVHCLNVSTERKNVIHKRNTSLLIENELGLNDYPIGKLA